MFVLAIDTATPAVTAGIVELSDSGSNTLISRVSVDARRHVEALVPQIDQCLSELGLPNTGIGAVVVGVGPGPFTGLRVGMATAAAYADALGTPLYGVCSLDAVAYAARLAGEAAESSVPLLVATDARRKEVYWAIYGPGTVRLTAPAVDKPARLRELMIDGAVRAEAAVGDGALQYADVLGLPVGSVSYPSCAGLVQGARERIETGAPTEQPQPLYLRRPDATPPAQVRASAIADVRADA